MYLLNKIYSFSCVLFIWHKKKSQRLTRCPNVRRAISEPISSPIAMRAIPSTATPCSIIRMSLTDKHTTQHNTRENTHTHTHLMGAHICCCILLIFVFFVFLVFIVIFVLVVVVFTADMQQLLHLQHVTGAWDTDRRTVRCVFYTKRVSWESTDSPAYAQTSTNVLPKLRKGSGTTWRAARVVSIASPLPAFKIYI